MLTLRQARITFRLLFLLPVALLGLAILMEGMVRIVAELTGTPTADDTASGLAMLGLAMLPLGSVTLVAWAVARRPQKLPPPAPSAIAPGSDPMPDRLVIDPSALSQPAQSLGLEVSQTPAGVTLVRRDRWRAGFLAVMALMMAAVFVGPPSISSGGLAFAPLNVWLIGVGVWISLFLVLLAMPIAPRRVDFQPARDSMLIADGRRERVFGLSRLKALEVEVCAESRRDSETRQAYEIRWHPALIGWFEVEGRELTPFALITGPRTADAELAERYRSEMVAIAEPIARGLSISTEKPETDNSEMVAYS